jgi:diguanylate cyclase (GGDEF)-like protein/PAS domain S-box-containing protein
MNYRFEELVNVTKLSSLLQSHHGFSGMAYGLFDTNANILLTAGWQDICTRFHRVHPISCARCRENDASVRANQNGIKGEYLESPCKNGLIDVAMPVMVEGRHLATFLVGQFFYEDRLPEREFFVRQADECGFDQDQYLAALERVPVFSREHIRSNMQFLRNMVELLAETGFANLRLKQETEERKQAEEALLTRETELQQYTDFQNKLLTGLQNADVVFWLAEGGRITYCNDPRFGEPFGLSEADMAAHPLFINLVHPDDRPRIADIYQRRSAGEPMPTAFEVGVQWVNGERREVEVVVSVIGYNPLKTLIIYKDITGRKRMEQALAVQEAEFRTLAENLPDNIARYDREGRTVYINPALEKALGATTADVIGTRVREFHPDGSYEIYAQVIDTVLDSGMDIEIDFSVPVPSEEVAIHQIRIIAEHNEYGEVIGVLAIGRDITERKQYEMELLQRAKLQEQLAAVAEAVPGFIYTVRFAADGYDAVFPYASPGIMELLGVSPEEIVDNPHALRSRYYPDDIPGLLNHIDESRRSGVPFRYEMRASHPEKGLRWIEMRSTVQRLSDGSVVAHGVMIDITERKRMEEALVAREEQFRTLLENLPDAVSRYDRQCRVQYANRIMQEKIQSALPVVGRTPTELFGNYCLEYEDTIRRVLVTGEPEEREFSRLESSGRLSTCLIRLVPERNAQAEVVSVLSIARDITERKRMEDALVLRESELQRKTAFQKTLLKGLGDAGLYMMVLENGRIVYVRDKGLAHLFGYSEGLLAQKPKYINIIHPDDRQRVIAVHQRRIDGEMEPTLYEAGVVLADGERREYEVALSVVPNTEPVQLIVITRDITERKMMEQLLHRRMQEFGTLVENAPDPIIRYDREARRVYLNAAFEKMAGVAKEQLLGRRPDEMPVGSTVVAEVNLEAVRSVLADGAATAAEVSWDGKDGVKCYYQIRFVPEFDRDGSVSGVMSLAHDISMLRKYQQQLHNLAFFDPLTGLPNRALFHDRMQQAVSAAARRDRRVSGLMLLDLDRFKAVNDSLGHVAGDSLLCQVGERLKQAVRAYDTVARLGGDEFAVILQEVRQDVDLGNIARKILAAFDEPFEVTGRSLNMTASIGIVSCPGDSQDIAELMQFADSAMYHAKAQGKNCYQFYSIELTACATERLSLEAALRQAVRRGEFELYYQPKVDQTTGGLVGAEALLRWHHPQLGMVPPGQFIPVAEDTGMIVEMGEWVLRSAFKAACEWNQGQAQRLKIAVNLSVRQFAGNDFVTTISSLLAETGCQPEWIELEITESLLLDGNKAIRATLETLRDRGFTIAIDDFGTGYSGLGYLARFPIHTIKIDRSFIHDITVNKDSAALVEAIISMAYALRMQVVAEGVETREQADHLNGLGCCLIQGYFFGKPMPKDAFVKHSTCVIPSCFQADT